MSTGRRGPLGEARPSSSSRLVSLPRSRWPSGSELPGPGTHEPLGPVPLSHLGPARSRGGVSGETAPGRRGTSPEPTSTDWPEDSSHDEPVSGSRPARSHTGTHPWAGPGAPAAPGPGADPRPRPGTDAPAPASGPRTPADASASGPGTAADASASGARSAAAAPAPGPARALSVPDPAGTGAGARPGTGAAAHLTRQGADAAATVRIRTGRGSVRPMRPRGRTTGTAYASTSDRSPPHSVWNAPSRSVRR